jgi:hypothetical protein
MKMISRRALLTGFVVGLGLPIIGCGEPLKSAPEGTGPAPGNQADWKKQEEERLKALKAASKSAKPARK